MLSKSVNEIWAWKRLQIVYVTLASETFQKMSYTVPSYVELYYFVFTVV